MLHVWSPGCQDIGRQPINIKPCLQLVRVWLMTTCLIPISMLITHVTTVLRGLMQVAEFPLLNLTHTKLTQAFIFLHWTTLLCLSDKKFPPKYYYNNSLLAISLNILHQVHIFTCCRFAACKISLNLRGSRNLGRITGQFVAHNSTFRC